MKKHKKTIWHFKYLQLLNPVLFIEMYKLYQNNIYLFWFIVIYFAIYIHLYINNMRNKC